MKTISLAAALGGALTLGSAHAALMNVGGVVWDPDSLFDFSSTDTMVETIVGPGIGATIQGYAKITNLNNTGEAVFCPGCELTYAFSGYTVSAIDAMTGALTWSGGTIDVYVDSTPNYNGLLASTATDGVLFLSLAGEAHVDALTGLVGTLHSDPTPASTGVAGDGRGFLSVTGGLAAANFDTNSYPIVADLMGTAGFADFLFTSSFQLLPNGNTFVSDDGVTYGLFGSNDLSGNTISMPEPATITLAGLALMGLCFHQRRKRV